VETEKTHETAALPSKMQDAITTTISILAETMPGKVGEACLEADSDADGGWWVRIPVVCHGTVETILQAYDRMNSLFVKQVPIEARSRISIDLQSED
jgi:hypothetical protein